MRLVLLRYLHFICIFMDKIKSKLLTLTFQRFPKCIRNKGCFIFFKRDWKKNKKKQVPTVETGNDILIYINIKQVFQINIDYTHC